MYGNNRGKVFDLLKALKPQEHRKFIRWLYYKRPKGEEDPVIKLYHLSKSHRANDKEILWEHLFPKLPYNDSQLRKYFSKLREDIEDFMVCESILNSPFDRNLFLGREFFERELNTYMFNTVRKEIDKINSLTIKNSLDFLRCYLLEKRYQEYLLKFDQKNEKRREVEMNEAFDKWIVSEKLKLAITNLNLKKLQGKEIDTFLLPEILQYIEHKPSLLAEPNIRILKAFYELFIESDWSEALYTEAKKLLEKYHKHINFETKADLYTGLLNYKILLLSEHGTYDFCLDLLDLYDWGLQHKFLYINGKLRARQFKNLIYLCIRLKLIDKAAHYLDKLYKDLPKEECKEVNEFLRARILFEEENYHQIKEKLKTPTYTNVYFELSKRFLLCMTYYELNEDRTLESQLHSQEQFIRNQKHFSDQYAKVHLKRIQFFERLIRANSFRYLNHLKKELAEQNAFSEKDWLMQKVKEKIENIA